MCTRCFAEVGVILERQGHYLSVLGFLVVFHPYIPTAVIFCVFDERVWL